MIYIVWLHSYKMTIQPPLRSDGIFCEYLTPYNELYTRITLTLICEQCGAHRVFVCVHATVYVCVCMCVCVCACARVCVCISMLLSNSSSTAHDTG